jgi:putative ABC transport system substrate-binding protein
MMVFLAFLGPKIAFAKKKTKVFVVKSKDISSYNLAIEGFRKQSPSEWDIEEYDLEGTFRNVDGMMRRLNRENPDLVVAVGSKALVALTKHTILCPLVFCMVLNPAVYELQRSNVTGVFLAASPQEQLKVLVELSPKIRNIGVLLRKQTKRNLFGDVAAFADKFGVNMIEVEIESEKDIPQKLRSVLGRVDALLMLDDSFIHNKETLDFVILKSLENEIVFMAISKEYVEQGALVSLSPSFFSNGEQAARIAEMILIQKIAPTDIPVSFDRNPELVINTKIARKIGLTVPAELLDRAKRIYE